MTKEELEECKQKVLLEHPGWTGNAICARFPDSLDVKITKQMTWGNTITGVMLGLSEIDGKENIQGEPDGNKNM